MSASTSRRSAKFRPCIDIHQGKVKQIVGGTLSNNDESLVTNFCATDSSEQYAKLYRDSDLWGGHIVLLSDDKASRQAAISALKEFPGGLQIGGGVTPENAAEYLDAGASHVIVTSYIFREGVLNEERLHSLVKKVGRSRLVIDLSCRKDDNGKYFVVTNRWQHFTGLKIDATCLEHLAGYCTEFLVHGVDVEGLQLGVDLELISLLGQYSPNVVTYAGGVSKLADLEKVKHAGRGNVDITVGSALDIFGGTIAFEEVVAWHNDQL
eukprot:CAMPEP_0183790366 /NCGR_PEP_ID=MMETSP0803_2-20130417/994_1 /TAXON_ID=195967 /ORGANISM="Crustomastix stigmata, Strain CCMP3273" /LENGTH=265 /DNA_ID=CAMNT_0026034577 /DNA_START=95 /DNA_END=892 /DNA_ORIENTATION=-